MNDEVVEVLKEIRDEVKGTNVRLESLDVRLESLEGRVDFLERRTSKGFAEIRDTLGEHAERFEALERQRIESELRLATEIRELGGVTRQVAALLARRPDDHEMVLQHEERISALERHLPHGGE